MHEHSAVFLVEVLDGPRLRVQFYSTGNRLCKLLVGEVDTCDLRIEGAGNQRSDQGGVVIVLIVRCRGMMWDEADFAE